MRKLVFRNIGVQKVERYAPYFHLPDLNGDFAGGQPDVYLNVLTLGVARRERRQGVEVVGGIALLLPAIRVQHLSEKTLLIQQSHRH